jgi:hypothetical protein
MTEVPNTILWIATGALVAQTLFVVILIIVLIALLVRVKGMVNKANDAADAVKDLANNVADTVSDVGASAIKPLAALKIFRTVRRGARRKK